MQQRPRRYFTKSEMVEVWDRWEQVESLLTVRFYNIKCGRWRVR